MAVDALPGGQEGGQPALVRRLDLLAQGGQRSASETAEDLDVAPLPLGDRVGGAGSVRVGGDQSGAPARAELAADELAGALELPQHRTRVDAIAHTKLVVSERPVRACIAGDELAERVGHLREERIGQPSRGHRTEGVTVEAGLVRGDVSLLPADA